MADATPTTRFRFWLWLIRFIGLIVPRRLRADWRQEWEAELFCREALLEEWDKLNWQSKLDLLWRSTSAFWDALWLQPKRLEDEMFQDLRFGVRMLVKNPGLTLIAILTLALGIGANAAIFGLVDKLLLRSLPIPKPAQVVAFADELFSYPDYVAFRERNQVCSGLAAWNQTGASLAQAGEPVKVQVAIVSGNYFDVLGVKALRGRTFLDEDGDPHNPRQVAVLSHAAWQQYFGGSAEAIGKSFRLNEESYTVIGVTASDFRGTMLEMPVSLWVPLAAYTRLMDRPLDFNQRDAAWLRITGRLQPGIGLEQAQASLGLLARQLKESGRTGSAQLPSTGERPLRLAPAGQASSILREDLSRTLWLMMTVVGLTLLIACINIAGLLLARATVRRKEMAVRMALGAGRWRLIRQLLTESVLLATAGGLCGLLVAVWLNGLLLSFHSPELVREAALKQSLDVRVLLFLLSVSIGSGLLFGLAPAWRSTRPDITAALKQDGGLRIHWRWFNTRNWLVAVQVGVSVMVLVVAGMLVKSLHHLFAVNPGFNTDKVLVFSTNLPRKHYDEVRGREFYRQLAERLKTIPGVQAVSTSIIVPLTGTVNQRNIAIEGRAVTADSQLKADANFVGPGYHELLSIPILQGRGFTEQDRAESPGVAVINEEMARLYFAGQNPIGKRFSLGAGKPWLEIIGVTTNIKHRALAELPLPHFDLPLSQRPYSPFLTWHLRTANDPSRLIAATQHTLKTLDPGVPMDFTWTMDDVLARSITPARMAATLTSLLGIVVLLLAAIGLYGATAYAVNQRTRELGIRLALGAEHRILMRLILRQEMKPVLAGLAVGLISARVLARLIQSLLFAVNTTDPLVLSGIVTLLLLITLLACYLPARRIMKIDPMTALRHE